MPLFRHIPIAKLCSRFALPLYQSANTSVIPAWKKIAYSPQRLTTFTFGAEYITPESFTHGGHSDSLHANPREFKLHSPKYHRSCPDFFGPTGPTLKLTTTQQHTCLCCITKMTPIPKSLASLSKPCTCPCTASSQVILEHHLARLPNDVPFTGWRSSPQCCAVQRQPVRTALPPLLTSKMLL